MFPIRVAQGATLFYVVGHTAGMLSTAYRDDREQAAIEGLRAYVFPVMGVERSHYDFYQGLGFALSLFLLFCVFLMQKLIPLTRRDPAASRAMLNGMSLVFFVMAGLCLRWFFPAPLVMSGVTALGLAYAARKLPRAPRPPVTT